MIVNSGQGNLVRLGDYIELIDKRNSNLEFGISEVCGVSNNKEIMPTKANVEGTELHNFFVVEQEELIYNSRTTRMGDKIGLGFNDTGKTLITSWNNTAFRVKPACIGKLLPLYLFIYFKRTEFDRYTRYNSWGSSTEIFSWDSMCEVKIPLPDLDIQQELVDAYNGLKALAEQNEALIKPLTEACQAYIVDCKKKYPEVELGGYIEEVKTINTERKCTFLRGVGNQGFIDPRQERTNESLNKCTIFHKGDLVYNPSVLFAGAIALNSEFDEAICTEEYVVFHSKDTNILLPEFIFIWLKRKEMGRYFWFSNMDSVRNRIYFEDTCKIGLPLPPIEVQQAIVNLYNCAEEAKKIATEAREKMKTLCPALVQRAING